MDLAGGESDRNKSRSCWEATTSWAGTSAFLWTSYLTRGAQSRLGDRGVRLWQNQPRLCGLLAAPAGASFRSRLQRSQTAKISYYLEGKGLRDGVMDP